MAELGRGVEAETGVRVGLLGFRGLGMPHDGVWADPRGSGGHGSMKAWACDEVRLAFFGNFQAPWVFQLYPI